MLGLLSAALRVLDPDSLMPAPGTRQSCSTLPRRRMLTAIALLALVAITLFGTRTIIAQDPPLPTPYQRFYDILHVAAPAAPVPKARAQLGAFLRNKPISADMQPAASAAEAGVEAYQLNDFSAATRAGMLAGDVIVGWGDLNLTADMPDANRALRDAIVATTAGATVSVTVLRRSESGTWRRLPLSITLGGSPVDGSMRAAVEEELRRNGPDESRLARALRESELGDAWNEVASEMIRVSYTDEGEVQVPDSPVPFRLGDVVRTLRQPTDSVVIARWLADRFTADMPSADSRGVAGIAITALSRLGVDHAIAQTSDARAQVDREQSYWLARNALGASGATATEWSSSRYMVRLMEVLQYRFIPADVRELLWNRLALLYSEETEESADPLTPEERIVLARTLVDLPIELHLADCNAFVDLFTHKFVQSLREEFRGRAPIELDKDAAELFGGDILHMEQTPAGLFVVGGPGPNTYRGDAAIILDVGGDDRYYNNAGASRFDAPFAVCIDFGGNDKYETDGLAPAQGAGRLGAGVLIDVGGKDGYHAKADSQGSGLLGIGVLADLTRAGAVGAGEDYYASGMTSQGCGIFGVGVLFDRSGHDRYDAELFAQGFGGCFGVGVLLDEQGWDRYESGGRYEDGRDPTISYVSLSQGCGFGLRPYGTNPVAMSGGIGALVDRDGHDTYIADYFSQGSSYYYALGILVDDAGDDQYRCGRYSQGAGTHYTTGVLLDEAGDDTYLATLGVSQGCGHDYSTGILWDTAGNDRYHGHWLMQGAGNATGIGLLVDQQGDDEYDARANHQGWGTWDTGRGKGSFGAVLDLAGNDRYTTAGEDNGTTNGQTHVHKSDDGSPRWGLVIDD